MKTKNLTLQEAIKSGHAFRRANTKEYLGNPFDNYSVEHAMADDFELVPVSKEEVERLQRWLEIKTVRLAELLKLAELVGFEE